MPRFEDKVPVRFWCLEADTVLETMPPLGDPPKSYKNDEAIDKWRREKTANIAYTPTYAKIEKVAVYRDGDHDVVTFGSSLEFCSWANKDDAPYAMVGFAVDDVLRLLTFELASACLPIPLSISKFRNIFGHTGERINPVRIYMTGDQEKVVDVERLIGRLGIGDSIVQHCADGPTFKERMSDCAFRANLARHLVLRYTGY